MKNINSRRLFTSLCVLTPLLFLIPTAQATEEILVIGKKLNNAISAGDYYNIGRLYAELARLEYQEQQRRTNAPSEPSPERKREICQADAEVKQKRCISDARGTYSNNIKSCSAEFMISIPYFGSLGVDTQKYQRCIVSFSATRDTHIAICDENKAGRYRQCLR